MSLKQSLEENKQHILDSLPSEELKEQFIADLGKVEEPVAPTIEEQIAEATAPEHVSEDMYDAIKAEIEADTAVAPMSKKEEAAAIEEGLKNPPTAPPEEEG